MRDWHDQHWKAETGRERLSAIDDSMIRLTGTLGKTPVQGSGNHTEEALCAAIDKKNLTEYGYRQAVSYIEELQPCWERLSLDEQFMLYARFVDWDEGSGIKRIMDKYHIGRSEAYRRSDEALKRLSSLIFW